MTATNSGSPVNLIATAATAQVTHDASEAASARNVNLSMGLVVGSFALAVGSIW